MSGTTVYAGGKFDTIGGQTRHNLAALDSLGTATSWNPNVNDIVAALALSGSTLYVGGSFNTVAAVNVPSEKVKVSTFCTVSVPSGEPDRRSMILIWPPPISST